jgi:hypothetical protein
MLILQTKSLDVATIIANVEAWPLRRSRLRRDGKRQQETNVVVH